MPGVISAISAFLGLRRRESVQVFKELDTDYRKRVRQEIAVSLELSLHDGLREMETDLLAAMDIQILSDDQTGRETLKIHMKKEVANKIISNARVSLLRVIHKEVSRDSV